MGWKIPGQSDVLLKIILISIPSTNQIRMLCNIYDTFIWGGGTIIGVIKRKAFIQKKII